MNEIINKFLLAGHEFMPKTHLRQPRFTYSTCERFTKNNERTPKFKEIGDSRYIYQKKLDKACFQHDMDYGDFKDVSRREASDEVLCDKPFRIAKNPKYDEYQHGFASLITNLLSLIVLMVPLKVKFCQNSVL